jgi:hypothetical protein
MRKQLLDQVSHLVGALLSPTYLGSPAKDQIVVGRDLLEEICGVLQEIENTEVGAELTAEEQKFFNKAIEAMYKTEKPFKEAIAQLQQEKPDLATAIKESSIGLSMKYWLMQFLAPLNRKELKAVVDGFMLNHITDETAHNLIKFLIKRLPSYYYDELGNPKVNF